jgi:outer membrane protein TolC
MSHPTYTSMHRPRMPQLLSLLLLSACAIHPAGEQDEIDRADAVARTYEPIAAPPPLPEQPTADDWLRAAFFANADLHARYFEWRAALERIPQVASPPKAALSFNYLFSDENLKAWDRTTLGVSNDPMSNIPFPTKLATEGRRALEEARAAGRRFEAAKFALQAQVLSLYDDLALHAVMIRLQQERIQLLGLGLRETRARASTGSASQQALLDAQSAVDLAQNECDSLHAQMPQLFAKLNALAGRDAQAPVPLPTALPPRRALPAADDELIRVAAERSPQLEALAREVAGAGDALERARQEWLPDFALSLNITGSMSQSIGAMATLPTRVEAIRAGVRQAQDDLERAKLGRIQYSRDLATSFVLDLYVLRNAERQIKLFDEVLVPRARLAVRAAEAAYATSNGSLADEVAARLPLIDSQLTLAELAIERDKALVAIETWSTLDVEALHPIRSGAR